METSHPRPEETIDVLQPDAATLEKKKPIIEAWSKARQLLGTWANGLRQWPRALQSALLRMGRGRPSFPSGRLSPCPLV